MLKLLMSIYMFSDLDSLSLFLKKKEKDKKTYSTFVRDFNLRVLAGDKNIIVNMLQVFFFSFL